MQHFLKILGKRYGEVRKFKKVRKFASSNLKFRSSKFKFTEILICNPGRARAEDREEGRGVGGRGADREVLHPNGRVRALVERFDIEPFSDFSAK